MEKLHIIRVNPKDKRALKHFVSLERKLLQHHPHFVSTIDKDVIKLFTGKTEIYTQVEFALFIAKKGNKDIGRCAAIINRKYQRDKKEQVGSIGFFAAAPDHKEAIVALLKEAEDWLLEKNITRIIAPWDGISATDCLYALPDESPLFPIPWHPNYYFDYLEASGYRVKTERFDFEISFSSKLYKKAKAKYLNPDNFSVRAITKKHWDADMEVIRKLFNATFKEEWECFVYTSEEFKEMFDELKAIADVNQFLIAEDGDTPIGFCFGMMDLSPMFRSWKGKFGIVQMTKALFQVKKYKRAGLLAIGVLPKYRGKGVSKALAIRLYDTYENHGLTKSSYYLVNDYNKGSRKFAEALGGQSKTVCYSLDKQLA